MIFTYFSNKILSYKKALEHVCFYHENSFEMRDRLDYSIAFLSALNNHECNVLFKTDFGAVKVMLLYSLGAEPEIQIL